MDHEKIFLFCVSIATGVLVLMTVLGLSGSLGDVDWVNRYPGVKDMVSEMRDECEAQEGVLTCTWNEKERDFVVDTETRD